MNERTRKIREAALLFIDRKISRQELQRTIVEQTINAISTLPPEEVELIGDIDLVLSEYENDDELRDKLISRVISLGDFVSCPVCKTTFLYIHDHCGFCGHEKQDLR